MPVILIQRDGFARQTSRPANHRETLPLALRFLTGMRRVRRIKIEIMNDNQIEKTIAVEINKRAPRTPARLRPGQSSLRRLVAERPIAQVVIQDVLAPLGNEQ